jgi:enterochelin esterase family protein
MKTILLTTLTAMALALPAIAQPVVSPDVQPDGRVTFRLRAPQAQAVQLHCEQVPVSAMQRDAQGVWTFTTEPLEPDIYVYSFSVDGVHAIDPANPLLKYNLLNTESQVHVPGPQSLPWELNDVPHGELHQHFYHSAVAGDDRDFYVYTPPGYDPKSGKRYPVLYLLHGYSDDASAWPMVGRANVILDNLIARGQAKPMIVVMPLGYGTMEIVRAGWSRLNGPDLWQRNVDKFTEALLTEVMPRVDGAYRIAKGREAHAIAGLSMGGAESLRVGLNHLDRFAWVGAFSAGGVGTNYTSEFPKLNASANDKLRLLWLACGRDDGLFTGNQQFCQWLTTENVVHTWVESSGAHNFRNWRRYLAEFVPQLFQENREKK